MALVDSKRHREASSDDDANADDADDDQRGHAARKAAAHALRHGEDLASGRFQDTFFVPDAPGSVRDEEAYAVNRSFYWLFVLTMHVHAIVICWILQGRGIR